jgi:hypothetical protein
MTRAAFRQSDLARAIRAAKSAGMEVARCEILPDGRIVLCESQEAQQDDAFGQWAAKRESRTKGAAQG